MIELSERAVGLFQKRAAAEQGGLLSGKDPTEFNPADPIRLWIIQVGIIICTASLLSLGLRKIKQPKVIAEVLGGIILGPTAFGRIPGFTEHIFPLASRSYLSLVANIGLCLFLFLVGLEIDAGVIKRNARLSATVALAGMVLPFGIGAGLAVPIYKQFIDPSVQFTHFMLFTGVAFSITAFPVLCRILTELKLLDTTVGIVVLSAGVGNDIIGWILLALSVALVNAGSGLTALYILLVCVGWTLFILFPAKYAMKWLATKTGSIESGPSVFFMTVTMLVLFGSSFFTDVIGVHAIFGAFLAGLIVPREGGLAIALTEKLEDMVSIIFLPLYFTLSGLSTDLGLLNDGLTWGYTIAIIITAFTGKFGGCSLAAKYGAGFTWRESTTIGSLMSCKGLVELIVLNVGLSAGILSQRVFSMFVLEALVLTFMTTPLVAWLYPPHVRVRVAASGANFNNVTDGEAVADIRQPRSRDGEIRTRFTVVLDKFEHLAGMMALTQLVNPSLPIPPWSGEPKVKRRKSDVSGQDISSSTLQVAVEALRIIELSDRVSAVMKSSAADSLLQNDPLLSAFRMFGILNGIKITPSLAIVKFDDFAFSIAEHARHHDSDLIMIPWLPAMQDSYDGIPHHIQAGPQHHQEAHATPITPNIKSPTHNPFEMMFKASGERHPQDKSASVIHSQFIRSVFSQATTDVALFVDENTLDTSADLSQHLFLPFFGGPDDRLALDFVMQLCDSPRVTATVVRITKREQDVPVITDQQIEAINALTVASNTAGYPDTYYGQENAEARLQSETADNIIWTKYARLPRNSTDKDNDAQSSRSRSSSSTHPRIEFREVGTHVPLHTAIQEAQIYTNTHQPDDGADNSDDTNTHNPIHRKSSNEIEHIEEQPQQQQLPQRLQEKREHGRLVIVAGRSRRLAVENHRNELREIMEEHGSVGAEVRKTIGDVASAFVASGVGSGIVVLQASTSGSVEA